MSGIPGSTNGMVLQIVVWADPWLPRPFIRRHHLFLLSLRLERIIPQTSKIPNEMEKVTGQMLGYSCQSLGLSHATQPWLPLWVEMPEAASALEHPPSCMTLSLLTPLTCPLSWQA